MSDPKADTAAVFDRAAADYGRQSVDFFGPAGRRLVELARVGAGERVLDVGAGAGAATLPAAEAVGPTGSVLAVDLAPRMVQRIGELVRERGWTHVATVVGDAEDPPAPGPYDVVLAAFVLFFLPDLRGALGRCATALAPGGRLAASWFGAGDDRWKPVVGAVASHIPEGQQPDMSSSSDFADVSAFEQALGASGFVSARTHEETVELRFPDGEAWCDWAWSHGMRALWEAIPEDRRADARRSARDAVAALVDGTGSAPLLIRIRYTTAVRP